MLVVTTVTTIKQTFLSLFFGWCLLMYSFIDVMMTNYLGFVMSENKIWKKKWDSKALTVTIHGLSIGIEFWSGVNQTSNSDS